MLNAIVSHIAAKTYGDITYSAKLANRADDLGCVTYRDTLAIISLCAEYARQSIAKTETTESFK